MKWIMATAFLMSIHLLSTQALAQDVTTRGRLTSEGYAGRPSGFVPYIGLGAGYTGYNKNFDVEGAPANALLLGSYYTPDTRGVFDLGFGIATQQFSQTAAPARALQTGVLEAAGRYQWDNRWQGGLVYNTLFDRGEYYSARQADVQLGGLQALKEFNMGGEGLARVGGRYMTGLNTNTAVNTVMIDLQFGWDPGLRRQSMSTAATDTTSFREPASTETTEQAEHQRTDYRRPGETGRSIGMKPNKTSKDVLLSGQVWGLQNNIHFDVNSDTLSARDEQVLKRVAEQLKDKPELYGHLEIVGRADQTGTAEYNRDLSLRRAEAVKSFLVSEGLPADKISTTGMGFRQPASVGVKAPAGAADRRAELRFTDVTDSNELRSVLRSAR